MSHDAAKRAALLFTAFEPSGDHHAAPVIAELIKRDPDLTIYAWGGPQMEAAGATLVEHTVNDAAMGLKSLSRARYVRSQTKAIKRWSQKYRCLAHVPVDSPAANWKICKHMKKTGARVVHLVAPQIWAWGRWRIGKLRRCTDLVLCLLPFEEQFFRERQVDARFIGHPRINRELDEEGMVEHMHGLPHGSPRVAIMPGSRPHEVKANIGMLTRIFHELQGRHHGCAGVICCASPEIADIVRKRIKVFPTGMHMVTGMLDSAVAWADMCLVVSGTVSLDVARQRKPMIGLYRTSLFSVMVSKIMLRTPYCLLPNIIANREICPEFIPCSGGTMNIVKNSTAILQDTKVGAVQAAELGRVLNRFVNKKPHEEAANLILKTIRRGEASSDDELS